MALHSLQQRDNVQQMMYAKRKVCSSTLMGPTGVLECKNPVTSVVLSSAGQNDTMMGAEWICSRCLQIAQRDNPEVFSNAKTRVVPITW
jgi:hypothetical protein